MVVSISITFASQIKLSKGQTHFWLLVETLPEAQGLSLIPIGVLLIQNQHQQINQPLTYHCSNQTEQLEQVLVNPKDRRSNFDQKDPLGYFQQESLFNKNFKEK